MTDEQKKIVDRINSLIGAGRSTWFGLLSFLVFIGVTLLSIRDADLFLSERQTSLPIVGLEIPTQMFFAFAPLLAATFSAYVHVNLSRLFTAIGDAPAIIEDRPLSEFLTPWLVVDLALHHRNDGSLRPRPLMQLSIVVVRAMTFWLTPLLLAAFYWRSFAAHNEVLTLLGCALPLVLSVLVSRESAKHLDSCLGPEGACVQRRDGELRGRYVFLAAALAVVGWLRTEGDIRYHADRMIGWATEAGQAAPTGGGFSEEVPLAADAEPWLMGVNTLLYPTDLSGVDFVTMPAGWEEYWSGYETFLKAWCRERDFGPRLCNMISHYEDAPESETGRAWCRAHPELLQSYARYDYELEPDETNLTQTCDEYMWFLPQQTVYDWLFQRGRDRERLGHRDLSKRDLRRSDLAFARLAGASLAELRGRYAIFYGADLEGADLTHASVDRAIFAEAQMPQAVLEGARLDQAVLDRANLHLADLSGTSLRGASLRRTTLNSASLQGTDMQGALLEDTMISRTTQFHPASLRGAALRRVDLSVLSYWLEGETDWSAAVASELSERLAEAFGDGSVKLPPQVARPVHWPAEVLDDDAFHEALLAFCEETGLPHVCQTFEISFFD